MKIIMAILLAWCFISLANAHSNHMSFEIVKHDGDLILGINTAADKITHELTKENNNHSESMSCTEQHKSAPCKKK